MGTGISVQFNEIKPLS